MKLELKKMNIQNFKGIRQMSIEFGNVTNIYGMNGIGKTSIPDAFSWVLFNKDSRGNAPGTNNFREKPLDADGNEIHNLETSVEMICMLDDTPFNLKRVQTENWIKRRGAKESVFQGNVSDYYINNVPVKMQEFKQRIGSIAGDDVFRMLGTLGAFNAINWKERRALLLSLLDIDADESLLAVDKYRALADETAQRGVSVDELRKVMIDQRKRLNDEMKMLPVRIDEAKLSAPEIKREDLLHAEKTVADCEKEIADINEKIAALRIIQQKADNLNQIAALINELGSIKRRVIGEHESKKKELLKTLQDATDRQAATAKDILMQKDRRAREMACVESYTAKRDALRKQYSEEYEKVFSATVEHVCPTCGQELPEAMIADALNNARTAFQQGRKERLLEIQELGKKTSDCLLAAQETVKNIESIITELEQKEAEANYVLDQAKVSLNEIQADVDFSVEPRIAEIEAEIDALRDTPEINGDNNAQIAKLESHKYQVNVEMGEASDLIFKHKLWEERAKRVADLESRQREIGDQLSETDSMLLMIESFVQERCSMLEESINNRFPTLRWRLFDTQINGSIVDTCIAMIDCPSGLVNYDTANTAAQVNADLEIINVLSKHYDVYLPLFVDNSERVNVLAHTDSQIITLSVSTDSVMKIEKINEREVA